MQSAEFSTDGDKGRPGRASTETTEEETEITKMRQSFKLYYLFFFFMFWMLLSARLDCVFAAAQVSIVYAHKPPVRHLHGPWPQWCFDMCVCLERRSSEGEDGQRKLFTEHSGTEGESYLSFICIFQSVSFNKHAVTQKHT